MLNNVYNDTHRGFVVFNDQDLTMEPVTDADLTPIEVRPGSLCASRTWSCNLEWYFVIRHTDMLLLNVYTNKGFRCRKKSARLIEAFLEAPAPTRRRGRKGAAK